MGVFYGVRCDRIMGVGWVFEQDVLMSERLRETLELAFRMKDKECVKQNNKLWFSIVRGMV